MLCLSLDGTGVGECLEVEKRVKIGRVDISSAWGGGLLFYQPTDTSGGIREELRNFGKGCKWVEVVGKKYAAVWKEGLCRRRQRLKTILRLFL